MNRISFVLLSAAALAACATPPSTEPTKSVAEQARECVARGGVLVPLPVTAPAQDRGNQQQDFACRVTGATRTQ